MSENLQVQPRQSSDAHGASLYRGFSIEAVPRQLDDAGQVAALLPEGTAVYVPCLPGSEFSETVRACAVAKQAGMRPVPHIPARGLKSRAELSENLARMADAGLDAALLIAGDNPDPVGPFDSTLRVLETGLLQKSGIRRLGFAGHPDGHAYVDEQALLDAMQQKLAYAASNSAEIWFVTQFTFEADPVIRWLDMLSAVGLEAPVRIGIPGPAKLRSLLGFAMKLGVAKSARAFSQKPETARLLFGQWTPEALLRDLEHYRQAKPGCLVGGVHVFAFGGLSHSAKWMQDTAVRG